MRVPILRLGRVLLTSIQTDLTDEEALVFRADLMTTLRTAETDGVVIDISGLDVVDSFMARLLNDTATAVRLLGGEVVVCGLRPAVALALLEMGREMIGVDTALNLEQGLERLRPRLGRAIAPVLGGKDDDGGG